MSMRSQILLPPSTPVSTSLDAVDSRRALRFVSASNGRQHPAKTKQGYIFADAVSEGPRLLGICDGVSGVQKQFGLPPDLLPKELLQKCSEVFSESTYAEAMRDGGGKWLMGLIREAFDRTISPGATTLLLAAIQDTHNLVVANLGDCGMLMLRPSTTSGLETQYKTKPLRVSENCPMQISRLDHVKPGDQHDIIADANLDKVSCRSGDIIVLGSDGLFDNLSDRDIADIVDGLCGGSYADSAAPPSELQLKVIANALVTAAIRRVKSGKEGSADDTTAIVAVIVEGEDEQAIDDYYESRAFARAARSAAQDDTSANQGLFERFLARFLPQCCTSECVHEEYEETEEVEEYTSGCNEHSGADWTAGSEPFGCQLD